MGRGAGRPQARLGSRVPPAAGPPYVGSLELADLLVAGTEAVAALDHDEECGHHDGRPCTCEREWLAEAFDRANSVVRNGTTLESDGLVLLLAHIARSSDDWDHQHGCEGALRTCFCGVRAVEDVVDALRELCRTLPVFAGAYGRT